MELKEIIRYAQAAESLQKEIAEAQAALKEKNAQLQELLNETIPVAMMEEFISDFTLESGAQVKLKTVVSGSLPSKGAIEKAQGEERDQLILRRNEGLAWIREVGAGDIIKNDVSVSFGKGEDGKAAKLAEYLGQQGYGPSQETKVHPQTLNAFLRERIGTGEEIPADLFSLFTGTVAMFDLPKAGK